MAALSPLPWKYLNVMPSLSPLAASTRFALCISDDTDIDYIFKSY